MQRAKERTAPAHPDIRGWRSKGDHEPSDWQDPLPRPSDTTAQEIVLPPPRQGDQRAA